MGRQKRDKIEVNSDEIRGLFDEKGLSFRDIDREKDLKLSRRTVQRGLKSGKMSLSSAEKLAKFLGVSPFILCENVKKF